MHTHCIPLEVCFQARSCSKQQNNLQLVCEILFLQIRNYRIISHHFVVRKWVYVEINFIIIVKYRRILIMKIFFL